MKISVGLPVYDGNLSYQLASCLLTEVSLATQRGDVLNIRFLPSCTNLAVGRNCLVKEFMESDDDRLVFLDADVTFKPGELLRVAHHPVDFVGGAYRLKQAKEQYPIYLMREPTEPGPNGLIQVVMVPTGFLSLSRDVFTRFKEHYPGREYDIHGVKFYCYFQIPFVDGALYTEDSYFCREWREKGEIIYLDPELNLTHWQGNLPYVGHCGNWYRKALAAKQSNERNL